MSLYTFAKLFCSVGIVLACFLTGLRLADGQKRSIAQLNSLLRLTEYMKSRIIHTHGSLRTVFAGFHDKTLEQCGFLHAIGAASSERVQFESAAECLDIPEEAKNELRAFLGSLGSLPMQSQLASLDRCHNIIGGICTDYSKNALNRQKSYRSLGALIGVTIVIILY